MLPRPHDQRRWRRSLPALALLAAIAACSEFEAIPSSVCGNGVVEGETEDCDLFVQNAAICRPPGTSDACRFRCDATTACPAGMSCVLPREACVRPASAFTAPVRMADGVTATNIDLVDTDGNGTTETFVGYNVADASRAYFAFPSDRDAREVKPRRIPEWPVPPHGTRGLSSVSATNVSARGVFAPIATGVTMLHRAATGEVQPDARFGLLAGQNIPSGTLRGAARVFSMRRTLGRKGSVRDAAAFVGTRDGVLFAAANWVAPADTDVSSCEATPGGFVRAIADRRAEDVVFAGSANVVEGSPCEELVVIFKDGDVRFFESCSATACALPAASVTERRARLEPPPGATELTEAVAADVDGDGHVDLLGAWRRGAKESAASRTKAFSIAVGFGAGTFPIGVPFFVDVANGTKLVESDAGLTVFRERRDVDGVESGRTFAVIADRVLRFDGDLEPTNPPSPFQKVTALQVSWPTGAARWEDPSTEDLDRDGVVDVVLRSGARIVVLRGNGLGSFGSTVLEATTTVRAKSVGDFDGDGLLDVAITRDFFTESSSVPVNIDVAYGAGATRLGPWVRVITTNNPATSLVSLRIPAFNGADSLSVIAPDTDPAGPEFVSLVGDGTQGGLFPSSAVDCRAARTPSANDRLSPRTGTIARVLGSDGAARDLLLLAGEQSTRGRTDNGDATEVYAVADVSNAKIDLSSLACQALPEGVASVYVNASNFCGDPSDEALFVDVDAAGSPRLSLAEFDVRGGATTVRFTPLLARPEVSGASLKPANVLAIATDLDGDGDLDVLMRLGAEAAVIWNDGKPNEPCASGAFRYERLPIDPRAAEDRVVGIATLTQGAGVPRAIVALTANASAPLRRFDARRSGGFDVSTFVLPTDPATASLGVPTALDIGDVDGDGLDDVVLADRRGIRVHFGIEASRRRP